MTIWVAFAPCSSVDGGDAVPLKPYLESFPSASRAEAVALDPRRYQSAQMVEIYKGEELLGYGVTLNVTSRSGKFSMQVAVSEDNAVIDVKVPDYPHARGRAVRKSRFLRQFKGCAYGEPLKLGEQIDGVSGATSSATAVTGGVRRALIMVHRHIGRK
jgi:hypothetical protein